MTCVGLRNNIHNTNNIFRLNYLFLILSFNNLERPFTTVRVSLNLKAVCCMPTSTFVVRLGISASKFLCLVPVKLVYLWTLFYYQLTHTTLKNVELLKHSKISKTAPTCFGLQENHHQGAKISTWLKVTRLVNSRYVKDVQGVVSVMAAYCDL